MSGFPDDVLEQLSASLAGLSSAKLQFPMARPVLRAFKLYYQTGEQKINLRNLDFSGLKSALTDFFIGGRITPQIFGLTQHEVLLFDHLLIGVYKLKANELHCHHRPGEYLSRLNDLAGKAPQLEWSKTGLLVLRFVLQSLRKLDAGAFSSNLGCMLARTSMDLSVCSEKSIKKLGIQKSREVLRLYQNSFDLGAVLQAIFADKGLCADFEKWIAAEFREHLSKKLEKKLRCVLTILNFVKKENFEEFFFQILLSLSTFESNSEFLTLKVFLKIFNSICRNQSIEFENYSQMF